MNGGVCLIVDVDRARLRPPGARPLPRRGRRLAGRRGRAGAGREAGPPGALASAWSATPPPSSPSCCAGASPIDIVTDQTSAHDPLSYVPEGVDAGRRPAEYAAAQARRGVHRPGPRVDGEARRGDGRLPRRRRGGLRLRQLDPRRGAARRLRSGPSTSPASCRRTSGRCSARARDRSAGRRSPATRPTSPPPTGRSWSSSRENESLARWIRMAGERVAFQGLPARICWLGYGERDSAPGSGSTRWSPPASSRRRW